jgi:hypothetical protein
MTVPRPELDDVRYADLVTQALAFLPTATPDWTDFNASDPGVTVTELLAYFCDGLAFTVSRYEGTMTSRYATLLDEPPVPGRTPADALARAVERLGRIERAVTETDVESVVRNGLLVLDMPLARGHDKAVEVEVRPLAAPSWSLLAPAEKGADVVDTTSPSPRPGEVVVFHGGAAGWEAGTVHDVTPTTTSGTRVRLTAGLRERRPRSTPVGTAARVPPLRTSLDAAAVPGDRSLRIAPLPLPTRALVLVGGVETAVAAPLGRVGLAPRSSGARTGIDVLVRPWSSQQPSPALCQSVYELLRERGVVGSRFRVVSPQYVSLDIDVNVVRDPLGLQRTDALRQAVEDTVRGHLHPLTGGPEGLGWPFGSPIYRSALNRLVERVPGVDHVQRIAVGGDGRSDTWPLAQQPTTAVRRLVNVRDVRVTVLDSVEGW